MFINGQNKVKAQSLYMKKGGGKSLQINKLHILGVVSLLISCLFFVFLGVRLEM